MARLVNLGSYEHERFELTIAVEPGDDPGKLFTQAQSLLSDIAAKPPHDTWELNQAHHWIAAGEDATPEDVQNGREILAEQEAYRARKASIADQIRAIGNFTVTNN